MDQSPSVVDVPTFEDDLEAGRERETVEGQAYFRPMEEMLIEEMIGEAHRRADRIKQDVDRIADLKKEIKKRMISEKAERVIDEDSGFRARLQVSQRDEWDLDALLEAVGKTKFDAVTTTIIDPKAVEVEREAGRIPVAKLRADGVVERKPYQVSLYIEPHKVEK